MATLSFEERQELYLTRVPDAFSAHIVSALESVYAETGDDQAGLPWALHRYISPHNRRLGAELAFAAAAGVAGMESRIVANTSGDAHTLVVFDPFVITVSKTDGAAVSPRRALFRSLYSAYESIGQYPLGIDGDEFVPPLEVDGPEPMYVIVNHGPDPNDRKQLGFVFAQFVAPGGRRFLGPGIDLRRLFGRGPAEGDQTPRPPRLPDIEPRA